ncbi:MAG: valine--tRNA ligase [Chlamydiia bacterium]|nr:valine--tRNA ligase [Chlamydiia bacterium]
MAKTDDVQELPKAYDPKTVDNKWYTFWEEHHFFQADAASEKPAYSISIPPPNVTGVLHMGHALVNTLQDILVRWKRMQGYEALWVPGTDHAGIATQTVVERHLIKQTGKTRKEHPREEFLEKIWEWKEDSQDRIIGQLKCIGASCDWSRLRFTMDEGCNRAVKTIFKKLYDEGLIYRGDYLVNWDPVTQTALADDEVEYEDRESFLWHFKYPLKDGSGFVHIATTRPETMLGDTAVAVSPSDPRYTALIGKTVVLPLMDREIPIIADHHVDPEFGTGMVKITPAHDPNDYTIGISHNLPFINIMTPDGKINENGGTFAGLTMGEARDAVVAAMKEQGYLEKIEPHTNRVGVSYRSKATIEPYMSKQWFVKMSVFAAKLREAVETDKVKIVPKTWKNTYYHWIDNLRDWCISRQLWWGHRIPVWYRKDDRDTVICYDGDGMPPEVATDPDAWEQDEDVLDTWFSSALWPFSILGWPDKTPDLEKFYPNNVLITGHDILFFWVARMIMMGEYAMGELPFPETFLHGLIYGKSYWKERPDGGISYISDEERTEYDLGKPVPKDVHCKWEKMSKTKGNIIDPLEIINEYGTDAMRMALCASATQAREIDLDRRRFEEFKNFANKVWNGARFVFMNLDGDDPLTAEQLSKGLDESLFNLEDHWILSVLNHTIKDVNCCLENYQFDQAAMEAYDFFWKEFCSYYVEIAKPILFGRAGTPEERKNKQKLLVIILDNAMRMIHPMAPFITEELFQRLKTRFAGIAETHAADPYTAQTVRALLCEACIIAPYPEVIRESDLNPEVEQTFATVGDVIYTIRNVRGEMQLPPSQATDVHIIGNPAKKEFRTVEENKNIIAALVKTNAIAFHEEAPTIGFASTGLAAGLKVMIPLPAQLLEQEKSRLEKEQTRLESNVDRVKKQLSNESFVSRAPEHLVAQQRELLTKSEKELEEVRTKLANIR